jgi:hypothetical protein
MTDIVTQLRTNSECLAPSIMLAAADEIEQLRKERDEARREVCNHLGWHFQRVAELEARTEDKHHTWDRFKEAAYRKWDCFKGDTND